MGVKILHVTKILTPTLTLPHQGGGNPLTGEGIHFAMGGQRRQRRIPTLAGDELRQTLTGGERLILRRINFK